MAPHNHQAQYTTTKAPFRDSFTASYRSEDLGSSEAGSIETLDRGTFDVYNLLKILNQQGYTGPIGLQGYGLTGAVRDNLKHSIDAWRNFSQRLAADQAENLPKD